MTFLLDVNVLIALIDPAHVQHDIAHSWFGSHERLGWATCALSQNGVIRIVSHPSYPNALNSPVAVVALMQEFCRLPGHEFWPDDISLLTSPGIRRERLLASAQLTDTYLLALAAFHGGKLVTLDRRLLTDAVESGSDHLLVIS